MHICRSNRTQSKGYGSKRGMRPSKLSLELGILPKESSCSSALATNTQVDEERLLLLLSRSLQMPASACVCHKDIMYKERLGRQ
jgi:hypothetical protein